MDANGCSENVFVGVSDIEMDGIVLVQEDATCFGFPNGTMEVTNVSGANPITYELDNNGIIQDSGIYVGLPIGSHIVTIYDGGNCVFTLPFTVSQPTEIQFQITVGPVACNGGNTGTVSFTNVSGGTGSAYQYSINNGATFQSSPNFTGLAAGTYTVQVMDENNCVVTGTVTITQAPALTIASSIFDLGCFNDNSGGIQIAVTGGTGTYQYSIDNGTTFSASESFFGLPAGTYAIVVQDAAGCQMTGSAVITQPAQLTATYAITNAQCNGVCDGQIVVTAAGGTSPYLYSSNNGTTLGMSSTLTGLCAGNVNVYVEDDNNCTVSAVQVITQPSAVTLTAVPTEETCTASNGQVVVTGSGGTGAYTYSINNGATYVAGSTFTGLSAGTYNVFIQDANSCTASTALTVVNEASPVIIGATVTNVSCNSVCDGEVVVSVSGGTAPLSYSIGTPQPGSTIQNICAGTYTLIVTDDNGCTDSEPVAITEPAVLTATITATDLDCFNDFTGTITFAAAGGTTSYSYSTDNGASFSTQSNVQFLAAGTYNTIVRDAQNCTVSSTVVITQPADLVVQNMTVTNASCYGVCDGGIDADVVGGTTPYNYMWTNGSTGSDLVSGLCAGSYTVTVEDANGCTITETATVTEPPMLVITSSTPTDALCNGNCDGTISINSPLATAYSIDNGTTFQPSDSFTQLCAGNYEIVVQDAFGCTQSGNLTIGQPAPVVLSSIPESPLTICYDGYGTLSGFATGGTAPYYYVWNTADTTQFLNVNLTSGPATFSCTVYDQNGCVSNTESATVNVRPQFIPDLPTSYDVCPGQSVSMEANAQGGLPAYSFQWLTAVTHDTLHVGTSFTYIPNGNTELLVVANDQCNGRDSIAVTIQLYSVPQPLITVNPQIGCSPFTTTFGFDQSMASSVQSATWNFGNGSTGAGTSNVQNTAPYMEVGCYDVTVEITTVNGCVTDQTFGSFVCVAPDPIADFNWSPLPPTTTDPTVNFENLSTDAVQYSWNFGEFGGSSAANPEVNFTNIEPGTYTVCLQAISEYGCINEVCKPVKFEEEFMMFVPNTFTPDGNEYNNTFHPVIPEGLIIEDFSMLVMNRWGEILFETKDVERGWDGTYHSEMVKEGVYVWTIVARGGSKKEVFKMNGHINLLR